MAKTETEQLKERIESLENDLSERWETVDQLESDLTEAYSAGKETDELSRKLREAKDEAFQMVRSLHQLDNKLIEVSTEENAARREKLKREAHSEFSRASRIVEQGLDGLKQSLEKTLDKKRAEALQKTLRAHIREGVWESVNESFSAEYTNYVPAPIRSKPTRDERGNKVDGNPGIGQLGRAAQ